jgi:hypothetical protein
MCEGAVKNAEYIAYAINNVADTCNRKIAVVAWSQGSLSVQLSLKYWPSTREQVKNFICLSADSRTTTNAWLLTLASGVPCTPSVRNKENARTFSPPRRPTAAARPTCQRFQFALRRMRLSNRSLGNGLSSDA